MLLLIKWKPHAQEEMKTNPNELYSADQQQNGLSKESGDVTDTGNQLVVNRDQTVHD